MRRVECARAPASSSRGRIARGMKSCARRGAQSWACALCAFAFVLVASPALAEDAEMRHVSKCNFCTVCHVGDKPPRATMRSLLHQGAHTDAAADAQQGAQSSALLGDGSDRTDVSGAVRFGSGSSSSNARALLQGTPTSDVPELHADLFLATQGDTVPKQTQPNCTECYGCNTKLTFMNSESRAFNITYVNEKGATSSWLFRASAPGAPGGMAVVKVYCVPVPKRKGGKVPVCSPVTVLRNMQLYQALGKLTEECGFGDIIPKVWVARVDSIMPDIGYHIRWHGLWMELVHGVSLEGLLHRGTPHRLPPPAILDLMNNKLNKTQVVRAAIFDLLTSQCDRHSQNIFINEQGQLKLIDNEACLQNSWRNCAFDSIFVPTTQKQEIVRLSNEFVLKYITADVARRDLADPQLLLDYRCWLGEGKDEIGTDYPPQIKQCLQRISAMTVQQVQRHYGLGDELPARNLHTRATDMLTKGYEWAYKFGEPRNAPPKRYLVQPKCCKVEWVEGSYRCGHAWQPKFELPIGDPVNGRSWTKPRPDTGTFEGGTRYL